MCLFCDNPANSREHVWPDWFLKTLAVRKPVRSVLPSGRVFELTGDWTIRCVCRVCNNGWMSQLKAKVKPVLALLSADISIPLSETEQTDLSVWALKTAMVVEGVKPRQMSRFFGSAARRAVREHYKIGAGTHVWLGRYLAFGLFAAASQIQYGFPPLEEEGWANITTLVIGHLALQVLALDFPTANDTRTFNIPLRTGPWSETLFAIAPVSRRAIWPPPQSFGNDPDRYPIASLRDRWRGDRETHTSPTIRIPNHYLPLLNPTLRYQSRRVSRLD